MVTSMRCKKFTESEQFQEFDLINVNEVKEKVFVGLELERPKVG